MPNDSRSKQTKEFHKWSVILKIVRVYTCSDFFELLIQHKNFKIAFIAVSERSERTAKQRLYGHKDLWVAQCNRDVMVSVRTTTSFSC